MRIILMGALLLAGCETGLPRGESAPIAATRTSQTVSGGVAYCDYADATGAYVGWCWQNVSTLAGGCWVYSGATRAYATGVDAFGEACYP